MSKAAHTRQFIIEQTAPIFNRQGYAGTSLHDLTSATGLTKGAIYGNFANKEAVALAAFDYNLARLRTGIEDSMRGGDTVLAQLRGLPRFYREAYPALRQHGGCPILNTAVETDDAPPAALRQRMQAGLAQWLRGLARLIERGRQTGEIRSTVDADRYATLFIALIEGGIVLAKATGSFAALGTALDHLEHLIDTELAN